MHSSTYPNKWVVGVRYGGGSQKMVYDHSGSHGKLYLRSRIPLDPTAKSIAGSVITRGLTTEMWA